MNKCPCGQPLHYQDKAKEKMVQKLVDDLGECVLTQTPSGKWFVPRHFIALHGLKAEELPALAEKYGFKKVS